MRLATRSEEIKRMHNLEIKKDTLLQKRDKQQLVENPENQRPKRIKTSEIRLKGNL